MYLESLERPMVSSDPSPSVTSAERRPELAKRPEGSKGMHSGVYAISVAGWVGMIGSWWVIFGTDSQAAFMVTVSTLFIIIFYGLAAALMGLNRVANDNRTGSFAAFMRTGIDTLTGHMSGVATLIQVALIPIALGVGTMMMAIIIAMAR